MDASEAPTPTQATSEIVTPTKITRRIVRRNSTSPSVAGTEYTAASTQSPSAGTGTYDMTMTESINMKSFAQWFEGNMGEDPSYSEILTSTAENRIASSAISKDVLTYIRERKELTAGTFTISKSEARLSSVCATVVQQCPSVSLPSYYPRRLTKCSHYDSAAL